MNALLIPSLVLIWNDAGHESQYDHIPIPSTKYFAPVASELKFCPVFFENDLIDTQRSSEKRQRNWSPHSQHPLILLNSYYGATIDWKTRDDGISPLFALQELFDFNTAAVSQYINMVEHVLSEIASPGEFPSYEHTKLEWILHYDYIKDKLTQLLQSLTDVRAFLLNPPVSWTSPAFTSRQADYIPSEAQAATTRDFTYLINRTRTLIAVCNDGKATLMTNASVQDARRSAAEARLVTQLTKATNRLTFIFLPISFITSAFGMNFREFGQGELPMWIWAAVTVPLLIVSIAFVERGRWLWDRLRELFRVS